MCVVVEEANSPDIVVLERALSAMRGEPEWSLGIGASEELMLCFNQTTSRR
jgi:hypothetical protein